ncbi:MAG TPA: cupin domain-containing protein [Povalibacter sp.]|uniref:cupin domain-containing protein n=1 Tax=Povalibacter sp. TaxID=1962978 RepID=UPI002BDF7F6F|nr:cupin domain-containing protein [Povalibacter sp.]HMN43691.1 cupin domain-containing protein [Povalibacter sp.]
MIEFALSAADFRGRYFEREPWLMRGALRERPVDWPALDELLYRIEPTPAGMQLFNRGAIPAEAYTHELVELGQRRRRLNKIGFYSHMRGGATLVINRLETQASFARRLCTEIGRFAGAPSSGNAYLSFSGDGTFGRHWDTHDVFAIQLIGRKRWQVFAPTLPLPLSHQTSERSDQPCPVTPVLDCTLEAGDVLYVPRGWWHQVIPLQEGSFHFSVGTYPPTTQDYVGWVCSRVLAATIDGRRSLANATPDGLQSVMRQLASAVVDPQVQAEYQQWIGAQETLAAPFDIGLFLDQRLPMLQETSRLAANVRAVPDVQGRLSINGVLTPLDPAAIAVLRALAQGPLDFATLAQRLRELPKESVHRAVLDLIGREVVIALPDV